MLTTLQPRQKQSHKAQPLRHALSGTATSCPHRNMNSIQGPEHAMGNQATLRILQAKSRGLQVSVNSTGDEYEREADRVAEQVMSTPRHPAVSSAPPGIQRIRRLPGQPAGRIDAAPVSVGQVLAGPGRPLEPALRHDMEERFGHDFSQVRVHSGALAERSARDVDAHAYTVGRDIVFGPGSYAPGSSQGQRLIAHELTHVVQQACACPHLQRDKRRGADKPGIDVSKLTDIQKAQLRDKIREESEALTEEYLKWLETQPITNADRKLVDGWRSELLKTMQAVQGQPAGRQRDVRRAVVESAISSLGDDLTIKLHLSKGKTFPFNRKTLALIAKSTAVSEEQLTGWEQESNYLRSGARGMVSVTASELIHKKYGVTPEQLRTQEMTEAEAQQATGSTAPRRTVEDRQMLEDIYGSLPEAETPVGDEDKLLEQLKTLKADEREQFKRYLQTTNKPGVDPKPLSDAIAEFKKLSPVDREVMEVNKRLGEEEPTGEQKRLEGPVLLNLKNEAAQLAAEKESVKKYSALLSQIHNAIQDPSQGKSSLPDIGIEIFINEMAMAQGLMAGGAYASPLVKQVVNQLMAELSTARETLLKEYARDAAITMALALVPGANVARIAAFVKKYYDKFQALAKVYRAAQKIEHVINLISGLGDAYQRFRELYHKGIATYEAAQALLSDIDSPEGLEERIEAAEEQLMEQFEAMLEGKFGDLLEIMYIPDDTPPDELVKIVFNIPRGLDALERMWNYYKSSASKSEHAEAILMAHGFEAGMKLYPFVGLLVAEVNDALSSFLNRKTGASGLVDKLFPAAKRTGGKERGRGIFRRRRRKHGKIPDATLLPYLDKGLAELKKLIDSDEPGQHWAPSWFRFALRKEVKKLNDMFAGETVTAKVEQKTGKTRTTTTEQVPLPHFKLRFIRPKKGDSKVHATLELNPKKDVEADILSNDDFAKGVKYEGTPEKRKDAIRDWLGDAGYQLTHDKDKNLHIRLPGGKRETTARSYLRLASGSIVKWKAKEAKDDYKSFLGVTVSTSADLPEGYLLLGDAGKGDKLADGDSVVQRKHGLADDLVRLGLDKNQQLVEGAGEKQPENLWPAKLKGTTTEGYSWAEAVNTMFANQSVYNFQEDKKKKDKDTWLKHVGNTPGLNRRPTMLEGSLGYTVRARLGSDRLSSRHLPELKKRDDKGHLVARRFDGTDDYANLAPMKRSLNQAPGKWYELEQEMAKSYTGKQRQPNEYVSFKLEVQYPGNATRRPNKFVMAWTKRLAAKNKQPADGDKSLGTQTKVFDND